MEFSAPRWQLPAPISPLMLRSRVVWAGAAIVITFLILLSNTRSGIGSYSSSALARAGDLLYDVQNATFGRIFCIALPVRTDQWDEMLLVGKVSGANIEMFPGVNGTGIPDKVLPQGAPEHAHNTLPAVIGAWRAHLNVFRKMIEEDIQTALILEADIDWDIRIKEQLLQFAQASQILLQPKKGTTESLDPTVPHPEEGDQPTEFTIERDLSSVEPATDSPYGDTKHWDVLWIGHCGDAFPKAANDIPLGRVVISDDQTVPQPRWLDLMFGDQTFKTSYPNNTRVVHRSKETLCSLGYAITQNAARKLLYEFGVKKIDGALDIMLQNACEGVRGHPRLNCISVQPMLMQSFRGVGPESRGTDIGSGRTGFVSKAFTKNIKFSTKNNLQQLLYGWTNFTEQWSDDEPGPR